MPPKHKNKSANPRDRRHENGLAPPAKQVKKQKSDNQLNGHASRSSPTSNAAAASCSVGDSSAVAGINDIAINGQDNSMALQAQTTPFLAVVEPEPSSFHTSNRSKSTPGASDAQSPTTAKSHDAADSHARAGFVASLFDAKKTVIAELSILDVVAILLVLMQLPYSVLGATQVCFAFLTFGSMPSGWTVSSILHDLSQSHGGSPSIITMLIVDTIFFLALAIPMAPKDFPLDLAQAVIAVSLGGGTSGRNRNTQSLLCFGIVATHHLLGQKVWSIRFQTLSWLCSVLNIVTSNTSFGPFEPEDIFDGLDISPNTDRHWFRRLVELHILSQGILRIVRRMFLRPGTVRRGDSDPAYIPPGSPAATMNTAVLEGGRNTSSDGRQPGPSPAGREVGREKTFSIAKRKKKQATFVRSQQPFWAAIANTKVTVLKEIEQSKTSQDSIASGVSAASRVGKSVNQYQIWVTSVTDTEVRFKVIHSTNKDSAESTDDHYREAEQDDDPAILVRVNGADWSSTSIISEGKIGDRTLLKGNVHGLTSLTNYVIEFRDSRDDTLLHNVTLLTQPDTTLDHAPIEGSFRPSSPISTLKKSISSAEANLQESRSRSKRSKKSRQTAVNSLKRDIAKAESSLASTGSTDDKQRQRAYQLKQSIKQAESATETLMQEATDLGGIPQSQRQAAAASKDRCTTQGKAHSSLRSEVESAKIAFDTRLEKARADTTSLQRNQEKLTMRLAKLTTLRDDHVAANARNLHVQRAREQQRQAEMARSAANERVNERVLQTKLREQLLQRVQLTAEISAMEQELQFSQQGQPAPDYGVPPTPESAYSGLAFGPNRAPPGLGLQPPQQLPIGTPPAQSRRSSLLKQNRLRSSSMLSNVSAFTEDEIVPGPLPNGNQAGHGGNSHVPAGEGSTGSSGGSQRPGSSSRPNTTSPAPPKLSPIGTGRHSPRNAKP